MSLNRALLTVALTGCIPDLTSPDGDTADYTGSDWTAPDNSWPSSSPPGSLACTGGWREGDVPCDFRLVDQFGATVSLWQFYGMVVVLDVSTLWCAPCRELAGGVNQTWLDYKDQGFMYLTVMPEDLDGEVPDVDDLNLWVDAFGITAPVLSDGSGVSAEIAPDAVYPAVLVIGREMSVEVEPFNPPAATGDEAVREAIESVL